MDFRAYTTAISRHKVVVVIGFAIALLLMILSSFKVSLSPPGLELKLLPTFQSTARLLVTQPGAPDFRAGLVEPGAPVDASGDPISRFSDPSRYRYLAGVYAQLAVSDVVKKPVLGKDGYQLNDLLYLDGGTTVGKYFVNVLFDQSGSNTLPIVEITSQATSEREATVIASRVSDTMRSYVARQQKVAGIKGDSRILLEVVQTPTLAKHVKGRPVIIPLAVLLLGGILTIGSALFLENLSRAPRPDAVPVPIASEVATEPAVAERLVSSGTRSRSRAGQKAAAPEVRQAESPPAAEVSRMRPWSAESPALRRKADRGR